MKTEQREGKVQTVLGLVDAENIGITTCHEHILWDMSQYFREPGSATERDLARQPVGPDNLWWVRAHAAGNKDDICQTDETLAVSECSRYKTAGGGTIVELTLDGLCRDPSGLARVARATGLNIVMGSGYYSAFSHPDDMDRKTEDEIAGEIVREITEGVRETGVCAGIIGEIGCSVPFTENEEKVLRASAVAQQRSGAPINVHPSINDELVIKNINILEDAGADLSRVAISHVDGFEFSLPTLRKILEAGCYVEYDGFGHTMYHQIYMDRVVNEGNDIQRIYDINRLIDEGYINQILLGQDVFFKCSLAAYGGFGYAHIIVNLIPLMRVKGLTDPQIHTLLVENPKRFLQFAPPSD
jgi:phosphotriesterase-related protein